MSSVVLIIIHGKRITIIKQHYRIIEKLIQSPTTHLANITAIRQPNQVRLDEGYILIDLNTSIIINSQVAFALQGYDTYSIINCI